MTERINSKYTLDKDDEGIVIIYDDENERFEIDERVFQDEMVSYYVVDIDNEIDEMIRWMYETKDKGMSHIIDNARDRLKALEDEYAFGDVNESYYYTSESTGGEKFDNICKEIINAHNELIG